VQKGHVDTGSMPIPVGNPQSRAATQSLSCSSR
jgi:hypothetical protein